MARFNISDITRLELLKRRNGYQSSRSSIRIHAYRVFDRSGQPKKCLVCPYDNHIEICHRKAVKDFPMDAKISEINDINNLIPLCPNHHWEFDNGLLKI